MLSACEAANYESQDLRVQGASNTCSPSLHSRLELIFAHAPADEI